MMKGSSIQAITFALPLQTWQVSTSMLNSYTIPVVALLVSVWIGTQSEMRSWIVTGGLLAVGLLFYTFAAQRRERWAAQEKSD
jgi:protein-S-isoprenylcysteine O-methyltransferase Ste14